MPSVWDSFLGTIKGTVGAVLGNVAKSGASMGAAQSFKGRPDLAAQAALGAEQATSRSLEKAGITPVEKTVAKVADPVLWAGEKAEKYVFSPIIARPISTAFLLTDPNSALYNTDKMGQGFQLSDITDAYQRSEKVSLGVAMTKSAINPFAGITTPILMSGGIDLTKVDLWNDQDVKKNFQDNVTGRWVTGTSDFIFKNAAISLAGGATLGALKAGAMRAGLSTSIKTGDINAMPEWEKLATDHIDFVKSNGATGVRSNLGEDIQKIAESDDLIFIKNMTEKHSNNPKLVSLFKDTKDPEFVRDALLADKGYGPAIERIAAARRSDDLWYLSDGNAQIQGDFIKTGKIPEQTPEQRARWMAAFDDAIAKDPKSQELFDTFLKQVENPETGVMSVEPKFFGKGYKPAEPIIGKEAFTATRNRAAQLKAAAMQRDFSKVGGISQTVLSSRVGGPVTVLMRNLGTYMPKGIVSFSGLRPSQGIDELISVFDDVPGFTKGDSLITVTERGAQKTVSQYRTEVLDRFVSAATDGDRSQLIKDLNKELARVVAYNRGVFDNALIDSFVDDLMQNVNSIHGQLRVQGFAYDPSGARIVVNPKTQRQLASAEAMLPFGQLDRLLSRAARQEKTPIGNIPVDATLAVSKGARAIFEGGSKVFSLAQLYKFAYIPKNSIMEPIISATMASGMDVVKPLMTKVTRGAIEKSANAIMREVEKSKTLLPSRKREVQREIQALSKQYDRAINNRDEVFTEYQNFFSDVPGVSPAARRDWADIVKADLRDAERIVDDIEARLNKYTVDFGQNKRIDVPTLYGLQRRIKSLEELSATNTNKEKLFPNIKEYIDGGMGGLPETRSVVGFVSSKYLEKMPGNPVDKELVDSYRKIFTSKKLENPLIVIYDNETGFAYLGEGNHRLQAAIAENIPYLPVRIVRGSADEMKNRIKMGKPVLQVKNNKTLPFTTGGPKGPVEYMPSDVHPSFVFDKKFLVEEDAFSRTNETARVGADIANAKAVISKAVGDMNTLTPELGALNDEIANAYARISETMDKFAPKLREQADLLSIAENRYAKKRIMPETERVVLKNGQTLELPSFTNQQYLGDAYFSEIANTSTRTLEFLGNKSIAGKVNRINRKTPAKTTKPTDPGYFDELVYIANNHMRGDILVDKILAGAGREELLSTWAYTKQGASYARNMGQFPEDIVKIIDESISYVNRYLPTAQARAIVAKGNVKVTDLQRELADKLDSMVPIQPLDVQYANPTTLSGSINQNVDYYTSKLWQQLGRPENVIREVWGNVEHRNRTITKLNSLIDSGQTVDLSTALSVRQSAAVEVVNEITNVFYTVPRQHRALYIARAVSQFPNASASGIYRYGRFAAKEPVRVAGFLNSYYGLYNSFGVDKYGNPVEDPMKAEYLLVPGSRELGLNKGKGIILSARATNFIANLPGPSWLVPIAVGQLLNAKPDSQKVIKDLVDATIGKIPNYSYDELFPYGVETNLAKQAKTTFTPAWARNLQTAFSKSETDSMWMQSYASESNRQWILYEMKLGPEPTEKSVLNGTTSIFLRKARTQFFSLFGSPQFVDTLPDSVYKDYYYTRLNKYKASVDPETGEPFTQKKALALAEADFQSQMSLAGGEDFPMDRLFLSAKGQVAKVPANQAAYDRIWNDFSGLAKQLEGIDPSTVALLTADLPIGYTAQVNKFLQDPNTTLPGGTTLNEKLKTPKQIEDELEKSRVWKAYSDYKTQLNDAAKKAGYASYRSVPGLVDAMQKYANTLSDYSEVWGIEYNKNARTGDSAWIQSQGLYKVVNNKEFMTKFGKTQFWEHAKAFLSYRDSVAKAYKDAPTGTKTQVQDQWTKYLEDTLDMWDPVMQKLISRYFVNDNLKENK